MAPTSHPDGTLPPELVERVWAYLAAFLPPAAIDGAVDEVAADATYWGDTDDVEVMKVAHTVLASRMRIAADVEVLVLNEDAGLTVDEIAHVLELPPHRVRQMLAEALAILSDPDALDDGASLAPPPTTETAEAEAEDEDEDAPRLADRIGSEREVAPGSGAAPLRFDDTEGEAPPATPAATPAGRARGGGGISWRVIGIGAAIVLAAILAILLSGDGGNADGAAATVDPCPAAAPICVTEAVVTGEVDSGGQPAPARDTFTLADTVRLWLSYERRDAADAAVAVRWTRDGTQLYETDITLPADDQVTVTLARLFMEQPGAYTVEVRAADGVLVRREFTVTTG